MDSRKCESLKIAIQQHDFKQAKAIIDQNAIHLTADASFLFLALKEYEKEIADYLLALLDERIVVLSFDSNWKSLIFAASEVGYDEMVAKLIDIGKRRNEANWLRADSQNALPLHAAAKNGHVRVITLLLNEIKQGQHADTYIDGLDSHQRTPLHYACQTGNFLIAKYLLDAQANLFRVDCNGETPLHMACQSKTPPLAEWLLNQLAGEKECLNQESNHGMTPLAFACKTLSAPIAEMLIRSGARLSPNENNDPLSAVRDLDFIEYLARHGAFIGRELSGNIFYKLQTLMEAEHPPNIILVGASFGVALSRNPLIKKVYYDVEEAFSTFKKLSSLEQRHILGNCLNFWDSNEEVKQFYFKCTHHKFTSTYQSLTLLLEDRLNFDLTLPLRGTYREVERMMGPPNPSGDLPVLVEEKPVPSSILERLPFYADRLYQAEEKAKNDEESLRTTVLLDNFLQLIPRRIKKKQTDQEEVLSSAPHRKHFF